MPHHSVSRDANGNVSEISGSCGSDDCPVEDVDEDDGSITYLCPVTGDVIVEVEAVDAPETPDDRRPNRVSDLTGQRRRHRRRR